MLGSGLRWSQELHSILPVFLCRSNAIMILFAEGHGPRARTGGGHGLGCSGMRVLHFQGSWGGS